MQHFLRDCPFLDNLSSAVESAAWGMVATELIVQLFSLLGVEWYDAHLYISWDLA